MMDEILPGKPLIKERSQVIFKWLIMLGRLLNSSMADQLGVASTDIRLLNLETRFPFEFGIVTMTELPHCFVALDLEIDGDSTTGLAADHFPPKWLTKDPDLSLEAEAKSILEVVQQACRHVESVTGETVFECWRQVYEAQEEWADATSHPPLLWNFGVALVERAMIDAYCRAMQMTFPEAVGDNTLGIRPGYVYDELAGTRPAENLPAEPNRTITVRHTVGHGDPLCSADESAVDDDLPLTLVENVETYGLDRFKIKITGNPDQDVDRLRDVLTVLEDVCDEYAFTLDANEQYQTVETLQDVLARIRGDDQLPPLDERLLFVEQPFPRDIALSDRVADELADWQDRPPIIIDESDGRVDSFGRALEQGYDGTSYKNCKGVFKGIINACLAEHRRANGETAILSGEDLTTIGPVSLQQDLAAMATVGIDHVERNGHHYFRGLSMFEDDVQSAVLSAHGDLFTVLPDGTATLDIQDGELALDSVLDAPFGYACAVDPNRYDDPDTWSFVPLEREAERSS